MTKRNDIECEMADLLRDAIRMAQDWNFIGRPNRHAFIAHAKEVLAEYEEGKR
jgi:hypothetical protein